MERCEICGKPTSSHEVGEYFVCHSCWEEFPEKMEGLKEEIKEERDRPANLEETADNEDPSSFKEKNLQSLISLSLGDYENQPCVCGSGERYGDCCLSRHESALVESMKKEFMGARHVNRLAMVRFTEKLKEDQEQLEEIGRVLDKGAEEVDDPELKEMFDGEEFKEHIRDSIDLSEVRSMETDEIISKLRNMGIEFSEARLREQAKEYLSAIQLADEGYYSQEYTAETTDDEDFIWMGIIVLWDRLCPEIKNVEMLDKEMQYGYRALKEEKLEDCVERWRNAWEIVKKIKPPGITRVKTLDAFLPIRLNQFVFNWCQDFDTQLSNAGNKLDPSYHKVRIKFSREFRRLFPQAHELTIKNFRRSEGDALASIGKLQEAENLFEDLIEDEPEFHGGYTGLGDLYKKHGPPSSDKPDFEKAEGIYRDGLKKVTEPNDRKVLEDRLDMLAEGSQLSLTHFLTDELE